MQKKLRYMFSIFVAIGLSGCSGSDDGSDLGSASCVTPLRVSVGEYVTWDISDHGNHTTLSMEAGTDNQVKLTREGGQQVALTLDAIGGCDAYTADTPLSVIEQYLIVGVFPVADFIAVVSDDTNAQQGEGVDAERVVHVAECDPVSGDEPVVCRGSFSHGNDVYDWEEYRDEIPPVPGYGIERFTLKLGEETIYSVQVDAWNGL
ncbi:hypothetical protein [Teredinibacter turnerae]|uniref:hypothetical protein n=1 Tax=Teredinibacter turnerae TaxID=2426 RepID=UPI0003804521|nr:hypothetical protein [Teredinibacter turnerae]